MLTNNRNQCIAPSNDNHWDMMAINWGMAKTSILLWLTNNQLRHLDARKEARKGYVMVVVVVAVVGSTTAAKRRPLYHGFFFFFSFFSPPCHCPFGANWQLCSSPAMGLQRQQTLFNEVWVYFRVKRIPNAILVRKNKAERQTIKQNNITSLDKDLLC